MPFTPFKKGGAKAAPKEKGAKPNPFASKKAPPFQSSGGKTKKTKRSPF